MSNLSRRGFVKGAGVAALGALGATTLAGCGNGRVVDRPVNTRTEVEKTPSWLGEAPTIAESDITETIDTEVLVVGCRTGGLPAVMSAAENGAKVLGIDMAEHVNNPREDIGAYNSRLQQEGMPNYPNAQFSIEEHRADLVRYANGFFNYDLYNVWARESGPTIDWLCDILDQKGTLKMDWKCGWETDRDQAAEKDWSTSHSPIPQNGAKDDFGQELMDYATDHGAEFRWNTYLIKCEQNDEGRVTGVIARDTKDQHYIRINASKGVILSTGGYAGNSEMLEARQPWNQRIRISTAPGGGNSGDGIKAALWCGARMDPVGATCMFNRACVKPDQVAGADVKGAWFWFGEQPFLKVNLNGNRFCNESGPYDYMLHSTVLQPHQTYVDIWDSDYPEQVRQMNEIGCCRLYPWENGSPSNMPITRMPDMLQRLQDQGYIQQADTIEELAEKLNIPVDNTVNAWNRYNQFCDQGHDDDYGKPAYRLTKLNHPPYFGVRTGAWYLASLDGIQIDTNMHPTDEDGNPIQGLYITGNDSGGLFAISYPNLSTGFACGRTMTFGRRAGRLAATQEA